MGRKRIQSSRFRYQGRGHYDENLLALAGGVGEAIAEHYGLDLGVIALPPSRFVPRRESGKESREGSRESGEEGGC